MTHDYLTDHLLRLQRDTQSTLAHIGARKNREMLLIGMLLAADKTLREKVFEQLDTDSVSAESLVLIQFIRDKNRDMVATSLKQFGVTMKGTAVESVVKAINDHGQEERLAALMHSVVSSGGKATKDERQQLIALLSKVRDEQE